MKQFGGRGALQEAIKTSGLKDQRAVHGVFDGPLKIRVQVWRDRLSMHHGDKPLKDYEMDYNDPSQRRTLSYQIRYALEAGQAILTSKA